MKVRKRFSFDIDEKIINDFEENKGFDFPQNYKNFLLLNNVCSLEKDCFFIKNIKDIEHEDETDNTIQVFLGFSEKEYQTLEYHYDMFIASGRLPKNLIPIARDLGGSLICIDVNSTQLGGISFWDLAKEDFDEDCQTILASNFNDFILSLKFD